MSDHHHHGTDPIVAGFLLGNLSRQHDAQQQSEFRTIQAAFMQQGYDVETAEDLTREYFDDQPEEVNPGSQVLKGIFALVALFYGFHIVMAIIGNILGW